MKAASTILPGVQMPLTMFGLPPLFLAIPVVAAAVGFIVPVMFGLLPISFPVAGIFAGAAYLRFYRRYRKDRHAHNLMTIAQRFWRGGRTRRQLITGHPQSTKVRN